MREVYLKLDGDIKAGEEMIINDVDGAEVFRANFWAESRDRFMVFDTDFACDDSLPKIDQPLPAGVYHFVYAAGTSISHNSFNY